MRLKVTDSFRPGPVVFAALLAQGTLPAMASVVERQHLESGRFVRAHSPPTLIESARLVRTFALGLDLPPRRTQDVDTKAERPLKPSSKLPERARSLYWNGETDAALELLSEKNLTDEVQSGRGIGVEIARGWMLRGKLLVARREFDLAARAYGEAVNLAPETASAWLEYGNFHHQQHHHQDARRGYLRALRVARAEEDDAEVAVVLNNLGVAYNSENRKSLARSAHEKALDIRRELAQFDPDTFLPDVAVSLANLGLLNRADNRYTDSARHYEEALAIRRELEERYPGTYLADVASTLTSLGNLYRQQNREADARGRYEEALRLHRLLAQQDAGVWLPNVAMSLSNLGVADLDANRLTAARGHFEEALALRRELAQKNPAAFMPDVALTLKNLGLLYRIMQQPDDAGEAYQGALAAYRDLARSSPEVYLPLVATTLSYVGDLRVDENRMQDARSAYEEARAILRNFAKVAPATFAPQLLRVETTLGWIGQARRFP